MRLVLWMAFWTVIAGAGFVVGVLLIVSSFVAPRDED